MEREGQVIELIGLERGQFDGPGSAFVGKSTDENSIERSQAEVFAFHKSVVARGLGEDGFDVVADTVSGRTNWRDVSASSVAFKLQQSAAQIVDIQLGNAGSTHDHGMGSTGNDAADISRHQRREIH